MCDVLFVQCTGVVVWRTDDRCVTCCLYSVLGWLFGGLMTDV